MPPKQQSKADLAKKQKIVEDKTFGLKNKNKSKNVQKYVQSVKQTVQPKPDQTKIAAKKKKEEDKAKEKELNDLFKIAVTQPKVPIETMDDWDQETLEKVVESKKTEYKLKKSTEIVCKYFLDALEKKQYGWFWVCSNGGKDCHYRHALPPGYVLKSQMKALLEEETEKISIEEEIENQRTKTITSTPMTPELFMQWKKKKMTEREAGFAAQMAERARNDRMSGRELFLSNSSLFVDDVEAYEKYQREQDSDVNSLKDGDNSEDRPTASLTASGDDEAISDEDDDELDLDELNELEASLSKTKIQIEEPGT